MNCPLCDEKVGFEDLFHYKNIFVSMNQFSPIAYDKSENYGRGDCEISLKQCKNCGYIFNKAFNHTKMQKAYTDMNYLVSSTLTVSMNERILKLKDKILSYSKNKIFLEVAPGNCDLLLNLAKEADFVYGIDPSLNSKKANKPDNVFFIQDFFEKSKIEKHFKEKPDFIIFRHLLEHIDEPRKFLEDIVDFLDINSCFYVEVPNVLEHFKYDKFFELSHDHCGYYQKNTLVNILASLGCELLETVYYYDEQWMGLFFRKIFNKQKVELYKKENLPYKEQIKKINTLLKPYHNVALYGGSGHGFMMCNFLSQSNLKKIKKCIDLDTKKQGSFIQNTQIQIKAPKKEELKDIDCVLMAMPAYEEVVFQNEIVKFANGGGGFEI